VTNHDFDRGILDEVAHRPWPLPRRPWVMTQTWHSLLFAHWRVDPAELRPRVPAAFELDVFGGQAWVGIVPFYMTNVAPRGVASMPWLSRFPELNVRTYVHVGDRPGVYFFSLDAGSRLAVYGARWWLNLPYQSAAMSTDWRASTVEYASTRRQHPEARFMATYRPTGDTFLPQRGSLEYFLTERYCLYHLDKRGSPYRLEIHHPPWRLQRADAVFQVNTMASANGLQLYDGLPLLHFSLRQDVVTWAPEPLEVRG
jgi:uncharacterized protein YqjF (DUF2071 family)